MPIQQYFDSNGTFIVQPNLAFFSANPLFHFERRTCQRSGEMRTTGNGDQTGSRVASHPDSFTKGFILQSSECLSSLSLLKSAESVLAAVGLQLDCLTFERQLNVKGETASLIVVSELALQH